MKEQALAVRFDPQAIIQAAVSGNASVETLERLLALAKDVRTEQARDAWNEAMAAFQAELPEIHKTKTAKIQSQSGASFSYSYAPLDGILAAVRPKLSAQGLSVGFRVLQQNGSLTAVCRVAHKLGHVEESSFEVPVDKGSRMNAAQQVGSASTYARRYAVMNALGIAPDEDTDAADLEKPQEPPKATRKVSVPPQVQKAATAPQEPPRPKLEPRPLRMTATVNEVTQKKGENDKGVPWIKYTIHTPGAQFVTFSRTDAEVAKSFAGTGEQVVIDYQKGSYGLDLLAIQAEVQPPTDGDRPFDTAD